MEISTTLDSSITTRRSILDKLSQPTDQLRAKVRSFSPVMASEKTSKVSRLAANLVTQLDKEKL